jgi:hypothetical protein
MINQILMQNPQWEIFWKCWPNVPWLESKYWIGLKLQRLKKGNWFINMHLMAGVPLNEYKSKLQMWPEKDVGTIVW